jgi:hypothetical protein
MKESLMSDKSISVFLSIKSSKGAMLLLIKIVLDSKSYCAFIFGYIKIAGQFGKTS